MPISKTAKKKLPIILEMIPYRKDKCSTWSVPLPTHPVISRVVKNSIA